MPLGRGLIFYVSSILLMPTVKYLAISMLVFLTYFLLVGQKGGMVFISDFKKMEKVYFMAHPSGWDIKYIFYLYTTLPLHYACQDSHIGPGLKLPLWQPAAARAASQK